MSADRRKSAFDSAKLSLEPEDVLAVQGRGLSEEYSRNKTRPSSRVTQRNPANEIEFNSRISKMLQLCSLRKDFFESLRPLCPHPTKLRYGAFQLLQCCQPSSQYLLQDRLLHQYAYFKEPKQHMHEQVNIFILSVMDFIFPWWTIIQFL